MKKKQEEVKKQKKGSVLKLIGIILILLILVLLIVQNLSVAAIHLLFWKFSLPVIAMILIFILLGFLLGLLTAGFWFPSRLSKIEKKENESFSDGDTK